MRRATGADRFVGIWTARRLRRIVVTLTVLAVLGIAGATVLRPAITRLVFVYHLSIDDPPARLPSPIASVAPGRMVDTWRAPRPGGRRHEGIDIFAPKSTPVLSTTRGIVTRVGSNTLGGQVVWVLGPGMEAHYYAHLDRFADIHPGDIVNAGDVLGFVGRTGNAAGTPFHLHYGVYRSGRAENPYPRLAN
jgi:peptidoglycan LD-endopeptidase LytH